MMASRVFSGAACSGDRIGSGRDIASRPRIVGKLEIDRLTSLALWDGPDYIAYTDALSLRMPMPFDHTDYSVVVKRRGPPPNPWRWEIYRAGRSSPIEHASSYFPTMAEASRAGKAALKHLLDTLHSQHLRWPAA